MIGIDEHLVIPNRALSVYDGAVLCWRGEKMGEWLQEFIHEAPAHDFPIFAPYYELTQEQKDYLWHGPRNKGLYRFFSSKCWKKTNIKYNIV